MKKVLVTMMTAMAAMTAITSCSDNSSDDTKTTPPTPQTPETPEEAKKDTADYTVIFWGTPGGNDAAASVDMYALAKNFQDGKIDSKKVKMVGMLKTSTAEQEKQVDGQKTDWSKDKTVYFCSDTIGEKQVESLVGEQAKAYLGLEKYEDVDIAPEMLRSIYDAAFATLNHKDYSVSYPITNMDSLANFIQRSAKQFPARHYVLMLYGHGYGFSPVEDTPYSTKTCISDDYANTYITADGLVNAVKKSGVEIQTLFTQCCLMATLENMAAYKEVFHYGILSAETTAGGYFPEYLVKLTEAGDDEQKMKEKSKELVDYYVVHSKRYPVACTSHGFYDLSQMPQLLASAKEAAQWYAENYADASLQYYIEKAVSGATVCFDTEYFEGKEAVAQRQSLRELAKQELDFDKVSTDELKTAASYLRDLTTKGIPTNAFPIGFCFSDVLRNAAEAKGIPAEKTAEIKAIYEKYMKTLKAMAYIGTTDTPDGASADYPYIYASPTVNILALNKDYYIPLGGGNSKDEYLDALDRAIEAGEKEKIADLFAKLFEGNIFATEQPDVNITKANYQASAFDKQVGWSKFLEMIQFNPSIILNPVRREAYEK